MVTMVTMVTWGSGLQKPRQVMSRFTRDAKVQRVACSVLRGIGGVCLMDPTSCFGLFQMGVPH